MSVPVFLILALLTIVSALVVVTHRNPVYSALGLVTTLFLLAVFFVGLDAHMVAVLQIIVYAGAIVVLFLFVIMLLNLQAEAPATGAPNVVVVAMLGAGCFAALLLSVLWRAPALPMASVEAGFGGTVPLGERLFTAYLLPFELTSVLLLVAIVGAVVLGKRRA